MRTCRAKFPCSARYTVVSASGTIAAATDKIVAGNVREAGIARVEKYGPFELRGDPKIISALGNLLQDFVTERRMRLAEPSAYVPCYRIVA